MAEGNETPPRSEGVEPERNDDRDAPSSRRQRRLPGGRTTVAAIAIGALVIGGTGLGFALSAGTSTSDPAPAGCGSVQAHLTVQGMGQAEGTPDLLTAVFGFTSSAGTSAAALSQNNTEVNQALLALSSQGVASADVQTTGLTLAPQYVYPKGVPTLTGYLVTNTVTAKLRNFKKAGAAIDGVVNATGSAATVNSLNFSFDNPSGVEDEARIKAVHQAVAHVGAMAAAAGRSLGPVCSLTDTTQPPLLTPASAGLAYGAQSNDASTVPVEPGSQTETDQVTMVYASCQAEPTQLRRRRPITRIKSASTIALLPPPGPRATNQQRSVAPSPNAGEVTFPVGRPASTLGKRGRSCPNSHVLKSRSGRAGPCAACFGQGPRRAADAVARPDGPSDRGGHRRGRQHRRPGGGPADGHRGPRVPVVRPA